MAKLTVLQVKNATNPGLLGDGDGLYLQVSPTGTKSWIFRYRINGKLRDHGLGSVNTLNLAEAREAARECRKLRLQGLDPIEEKKKQRISARLEEARSITFADCAKRYIEAHKSGWKNAKHAWQWENTLSNHAYPVFGDLPVADVDVKLVLKVIEPIWLVKHETASRLRGRIESILDWARVYDFRKGENPARWRGHLSHLLPPPDKIAKVEHLAALPHAEVAEFWGKLAPLDGMGAEALRLVILTAARSGEVRGATRDEFDLEQAVWTIPGERMKMGKEHRVPLSPPAVELMKEILERRTGDLLFPGLKKREPISEGTMLRVIRKGLGIKKLTVHGFRSSFRDWAAECTDIAGEVAEAALAHTLSNKVEAAYRRTDLFDKRRTLMTEWADYCVKKAGKGQLVKTERAT